MTYLRPNREGGANVELNFNTYVNQPGGPVATRLVVTRRSSERNDVPRVAACRVLSRPRPRASHYVTPSCANSDTQYVVSPTCEM